MPSPKLVFTRSEGAVICLLTTTMMAVINGDPQAGQLVRATVDVLQKCAETGEAPDGANFAVTAQSIAEKIEKFVKDSRKSLILPEGYGEDLND